jgi:hypothetical protein
MISDPFLSAEPVPACAGAAVVVVIPVPPVTTQLVAWIIGEHRQAP